MYTYIHLFQENTKLLCTTKIGIVLLIYLNVALFLNVNIDVGNHILEIVNGNFTFFILII